MQEGQRKLLSTITFQGKEYNIFVSCQMTFPNVYYLVLCKGDWQVANLEVLATPLLDDTPGNQTKWPEPKDYVNWAASILQTEWAKIEGNVPSPAVTWTERLEAWLFKVAFFLNSDGTHIIKIVE